MFVPGFQYAWGGPRLGRICKVIIVSVLQHMYTLWKTDQVYDPKRNGEHSREEEPRGLLSGKISTIDTLEKTETSQKKNSPSVRRATRDGLSGKLSPVGPLSGKTIILEKSYS